MKNTSRKPYIYKVTNLENHQYYIGSQCRGKTVGVNYFTSSTNKAFKDGFKAYREEKYKIEIIKEFEDPDECGRAENYMIRNHMLLKDGLCLNRACHCNGKKIFSRVGTHPKAWNKGIPHTEETRKKMSTALKGHPAWNKGMHHSEETKQKLSTALKGRPSPNKGTHWSEETRKKQSEARKGLPAWNKGMFPSEETRKKMSISKKGQSPWNKGIPHTEETRKKMSTALKGHPAWNKGMHRSEETRKKLSESHKGRPAINRIKISIEGTVFDSITEASKYYNVHITAIRYWIKNKNHNAVYIEK